MVSKSFPSDSDESHSVWLAKRALTIGLNEFRRSTNVKVQTQITTDESPVYDREYEVVLVGSGYPIADTRSGIEWIKDSSPVSVTNLNAGIVGLGLGFERTMGIWSMSAPQTDPKRKISGSWTAHFSEPFDDRDRARNFVDAYLKAIPEGYGAGIQSRAVILNGQIPRITILVAREVREDTERLIDCELAMLNLVSRQNPTAYGRVAIGYEVLGDQTA